jgi:hypothetical protein
MDWIHLVQDREHWKVLVNTVMNFGVLIITLYYYVLKTSPDRFLLGFPPCWLAFHVTLIFSSSN